MKNKISIALLSMTVAVSMFASAQDQKTPPSAKTAAKTERKSAPAEKVDEGKSSAKGWKAVPIPALPAFKPQQPTRVEFANGMVVFLQADHELPLISGFARIRGGSRTEPAAKIGLVDIFGDSWRTSGTAKMNGDQMDDYLEARAAKIETDGGVDSTSISFDCLKQDFTDVFALWQDLLQHPEFRDDKIDLTKDQIRTGISRRNDNSQGIAGRESSLLAYGKDNPYVRETQYYTIAGINKDDLTAWHKQHVAPNNIMIGIEGDFDEKEMEAALHKAFDGWAKGTAEPEPKIEFTPAKPGIYVADKPEVNQSEIRMVELGIERKNPDYFAIAVFNELFGGGFSSRLFSNLRTRQGLAYSVGGGIGSAFDHPGVTRLSIGTKTATTAESIKGLFAQIDELKTKPPTDAELKRAKDSVLNSFVFNFDTPSKILHEQMTYEFYGYPKDFLEKFRTEVEKVTLADVMRVGPKYLHKDQLAIVVVGNASQIEKSLAGYGPLTKLDISIPTEAPGATAAAAKPAASNPEGKALIAKVVETMGGAAKINAVKTLGMDMTLTQTTPMGPMDLSMKGVTLYPEKTTVAKLTTPQGELTVVASPDKAFMAMGGRSQDLPERQKKEQLDEITRDLLSIAQHANDPAYVFAADGHSTVDGQQTDVLQVVAGDQKITWDVDASGHVLRASFNGMGDTGPSKMVDTYSGYKNMDGITMYTHVSRTSDGKPLMSAELKSLQVNPTVDPKMFEKP